MEVCSQGHQIPSWAEGRCPRCAQTKRNSWQRGTPKTFNPGRYFDAPSGNNTYDPFAPKENSLPADKQMPSFVRPPKPATGPKAILRPKAEPNPTPKTQATVGTGISDTKRYPGMILYGIMKLLEAVCGSETTLETILSRENFDSRKVRELIDARHSFVTDVRDGWFTLFKEVLIREDARVISRGFSLDGLSAAKDEEELAQRCKMSVQEMESRRIRGMQTLRYPINRVALIKCVVEAANRHRE